MFYARRKRFSLPQTQRDRERERESEGGLLQPLMEVGWYGGEGNGGATFRTTQVI